MSASRKEEHDINTADAEALDEIDKYQERAEQTSSFKAKLSQFTYNNDSQHKMSINTGSRVLRSANPKVTTSIPRKVSKPASSRGSSQDPSDDMNVTKPQNPLVTTTNATKRKSNAISTDSKKAPSAKKARTTKPNKSSTASSIPLVNKLKDSVCPGLILISVGVNPGKLTGQLGHPYSHKTNKYWPGMHAAGITPIRHKPEDAPQLMSLYGLGHTNIVPDIATESESGLTTEDFLRGAAILDLKIRELKPQAVMLLGRGIWYRWMQYKTGKPWHVKRDGPLEMGLQDEEHWVGREVGKDGKVVWRGARTFVLESPSGQAAISNQKRLESWRLVGEWFGPRREEWMRERAREKEEMEEGKEDVAE